MNRQILKPQVDVPLCVLLDKGPEGKETTSQRGDVQFQYTLNNDSCVMWLPPEARNAILRSRAQAGDQIQIVKTLRGRNAYWNVEVLAPEPQQPPQQTTRMVAPRPSYAQAPPQQRAPQPQPAAEPPAEPPTMEQVMTRCLEISALANWRAFQNVKAAGVMIDAPTWEDVRAAGISIFIERARNARENGGSR